MIRNRSLFSTLFISSFLAQAQASEENNLNVLVAKTVTSVANTEQKLSEVLPSANVISSSEIEQSAAPTLIDLLQSQPGIEIGRNGGPGTISSVFMRGQASNSVAIFIDGVRVQTDQYGGIKLVDIPTSQIERIEILRGNMSAIYGEAAIGGAIHIFTKRRANASGFNLSSTVGSRDTSSLNLGYSGGTDDLTYNLSVERFETTNDSAINPAQQTNANPDKDPYDRTSVFASLEKQLNANSAVGLQANRIRSSVDYDSSFDSPTDLHYGEQTSQDATLYWKVSPRENLDSQLSLTRSKYEYLDFKNASETSRSLGNQTSANIENSLAFDSGVFNFGLSSTQADYSSYGSKYERDSLGYFAGYNGTYGSRVDYQINLRHDEIDSDLGTSSVSNEANTWLVGTGYKLTESTKITGLYSTAFRAPNTAELANTPNLVAEAHDGYELGIQHDASDWSARLVKFKTDTTNAISYSGTWSCVSNCYENIGSTTNQGYEFSINGFVSDVDYEMSYVYQQPEDGNGNRLARRARNYATLDLGGLISGYDWGLQLTRSGDRVDFGNTLESYTVLNASLSRTFASNWRATLKLENILDEEYQLAYGYDAVPRGIFLTLSYKPQ